MFTLFVIGMACLMAVQGEPEAEADPQFFYPNTYPVYNNYYPPNFYPVVRTPVVQKATVVEPPKIVRTAPAATTHFYPTSAYYPTYPSYPNFRYTPLIYYPPQFIQQVKPAVEQENDVAEDSVVDARDSMEHKPLRQIIPIFGAYPNTRIANNQEQDANANNQEQVIFLRPNDAPVNEIPEEGENDKLIHFRSLPYTQSHLNRVPVANFGK